MYDAADTVVAQRLSQVDGVAEVSVNGAEQPAIRIRVNPIALASMGLSMEDVRTAVANANAAGPIGTFDGGERAVTIATNDQMRAASQYEPLVIRAANGTVVRLSAIASIEPGVRNSRSFGWYNRQPSILLVLTKSADANVIETVDRVRAMLPEIKKWIPAGVDIEILSDRTQTIRASVFDMQLTLVIAIALVMMVVFLFLRRGAATIAAGVTVPLSLAGTCALMWVAGFSINNLSLMALVISVGFVVDDAIVMIENCFRNLEKGMTPVQAAMEGARQIGFTVVSISISLIAAFIPLLFMTGVIGRVFREFSVTLVFAIAISMVVSLTLTPMICAHFVRKPPSPDATWLDRAVERSMAWMVGALWAQPARGAAALGADAAGVRRHHRADRRALRQDADKGWFPFDDTGLIWGSTQASPEISFQAMFELQQQANDILLADPAIAGVGSSIGTSSYNSSVNRGQLFISLKPLSERRESAWDVINRLRPKLDAIPGLRVFMFPAQDVRTGGRQSDSSYQYTLWSPDYQELIRWAPIINDRLQKVPEIVDVSSDRQQGGLQVNVHVDRLAASRLGVRAQDIQSALNNAFAQRQVSTLYTQRNNYRVILEIDPQYQRDPTDLDRIYVPGANGAQVPLSAVTRIERGLQPLVINHQGQFPAVTDQLQPGAGRHHRPGDARGRPRGRRVAHAGHASAPNSRATPAPTASRSATQPLLILAALIAVYIVLGVLYESLAHPLTIISTLPSAGLGALLALQIFRTDLSLIALIGIILLIGIVKKNGIIMVDFALEAERNRGLEPEQAIFEACMERFRPILMTTLAALLGALPLVFGSGPGSEMRRPLGITIVGGLIVSQMLTLYTTPVIYLLLDRLHRRLWGARQHREPGQGLRAAARMLRP